MKRDPILDHLLGELSAEEESDVARLLSSDAGAAARLEAYERAVALVRAAASDGWEARKARLFRLDRLLPFAAAAAILALVMTAWLLRRVPPGAHFEPDVAYGYLWPQETDSRGGVPLPASDAGYLLRNGSVLFSPVGSAGSNPAREGETIPEESEITTERAVRLDAPGGAILFVGPRSTAALRLHRDGGPAIRLRTGVVAAVAGRSPVRIAVENSDLLVALREGASVVGSAPAEASCLRGRLELDVGGREPFVIPVGERIPAACAKEPRTAPIEEGRLDLEWYDELVYRASYDVPLAFERAEAGLRETGPLQPLADDLLYLRVVPAQAGELSVRFGGEPRRFDLARGRPFELRIPFSALGPGPRLEIRHPGRDGALRSARICRYER